MIERGLNCGCNLVPVKKDKIAAGLGGAVGPHESDSVNVKISKKSPGGWEGEPGLLGWGFYPGIFPNVHFQQAFHIVHFT